MGSAIQTQNLQTRVSMDFLAKLDEWRRAQPDIPTRTEAIRQLVEYAFKCLADNHKKPRK